MNSRIRAFSFTILGAFALSAMVTAPASAGGPIGTCASGVPQKWANGGVGIPFNPDQGNLGPSDHATAVGQLQAAFDVWGAVPTATATYVNAGELPVDVTVDNFDPWLNPTAPDGLSAIVFDDDGQIFDLLFGPGSGILGFAGPEWVDTSTCTVTEGVSFLNGPSFDNVQAAKDVMVHEFGHYSGLAHTVVNGQNLAFADPTGPAPGPGAGDSPLTDIETMYPFYFGPGSGFDSVAKDDESSLSALYPEPSFAATTGSIAGTVYAPNGTTPLTGINVIARNPANPFVDAVSALSGDYSFTAASDDPAAGKYTLRGLTPGASYLVYIDGILAGGFSTTPRSLPGPEEYYNGAAESASSATDDPQASTAVASVAGVPTSGINIISNSFAPGPVPLGDDAFVEIFPKNRINFCGIEFDSFFINSNGSVSFGGGDGGFFATDQDFLIGPPRVAPYWTDLVPNLGGTVSWGQTANAVTVSWDGVPSFGGPTGTGSNTFSVKLTSAGRTPVSRFTNSYGAVSALDGIAGFSCGGRYTSGYEKTTDIGATSTINARTKSALWEKFAEGGNAFDLANTSQTYNGPGEPLRDVLENGNNIAHNAYPIYLPFNTVDLQTQISPLGNDVDFYWFNAKAGDIVVAELLPGSPNTDLYMGLIVKSGGNFQILATSDDEGAGLLPRMAFQIAQDGKYYIGVTAFGDTGFTGAGTDFGRYNLSVVGYRGNLVSLGDDDAQRQPFGFRFPFNGETYPAAWINSNGNFTFTGGDRDFSESVSEFLAGLPRVAPLWDDLSPQFGLVIAEPATDRMTIHFASVPGFFDDRPNSFSTEFNKNGRIRVGWQGSSRLGGLVGVTAGNGAADPGPSDLSTMGSWPVNGTTYQLFTGGVIPFFVGADYSDFDLYFRTLIFRP